MVKKVNDTDARWFESKIKLPPMDRRLAQSIAVSEPHSWMVTDPSIKVRAEKEMLAMVRLPMIEMLPPMDRRFGDESAWTGMAEASTEPEMRPKVAKWEMFEFD
jgi:hypothetical protein